MIPLKKKSQASERKSGFFGKRESEKDPDRKEKAWERLPDEKKVVPRLGGKHHRKRARGGGDKGVGGMTDFTP